MEISSVPHYYSQSAEADYFVWKVLSETSLSSSTVNLAMIPWHHIERIFADAASDPKLLSTLLHPYVGLVDLFNVPRGIRTTHQRLILSKNDEIAFHIMPLSHDQRRETGAPSTVDSQEAFQRNWRIYSKGCLINLLDWSNVVVAGGAVQICLAPIPLGLSDSDLDAYYQVQYPTSDIDLFLWGFSNKRQLLHRVRSILHALKIKFHDDFTLSRSRYAITVHLPQPYRNVQIVNHVYASPSGLLADFDLDASCSLFDGSKVWACPRAVIAMMRQRNTYDPLRTSPSHVIRLAKYAIRGFEVYVPGLWRTVEPSVIDQVSNFARDITMDQDLVELLSIERQLQICPTIAEKYSRLELITPAVMKRKANKRAMIKYLGNVVKTVLHLAHNRVFIILFSILFTMLFMF